MKRVFYGIVLTFSMTTLSAVTLMLLWNWFPAEIFPITRINFWESAGLSILVGYIVASFNYSEMKNAEYEADYLANSIGYYAQLCTMSIGLGWLIQSFMVG